MGLLDTLIGELQELPPEVRKKALAQAAEATKDMPWVPNPGPQYDAFISDADETLFGGEAGGGKTDLVVGLSLTEHHRSMVLRRTALEADKIYEVYERILDTTEGRAMGKGWKYKDKRIIIGGCEQESDKQKRKGTPNDLIAFDELVDFSETQYTFIIGWNRTVKKGQRCRVVSTTNPPTTPEGMWVVRRWAPWLDPKHPKPAKDGELRWFTNINGKDTEVDGPGPHDVGRNKMVMAKSRTFIRSKLSDNPDLTATPDYQATLDALPEEYRLAYAEGKFDAGLKDQALQVIPTEWIRLAQERWKDYAPPGIPMCAISADCTGGGKDPMVIAMRYDGYYPHLIELPAKLFPPDRAGAFGAGQLISYRRHNAVVIIDMGGGYGNSMYEVLANNEITAVAYKGAEASNKRTRDGKLKFTNKRSQVIWQFREALDPNQSGGSPIALPPDQMLMADLAAPTFRLTPNGIEVEAKVKVCERLGRSTDRGDAVEMCWDAGPTYLTQGASWESSAEHGLKGRRARSVDSKGHSFGPNQVGRRNRQ